MIELLPLAEYLFAFFRIYRLHGLVIVILIRGSLVHILCIQGAIFIFIYLF